MGSESVELTNEFVDLGFKFWELPRLVLLLQVVICNYHAE